MDTSGCYAWGVTSPTAASNLTSGVTPQPDPVEPPSQSVPSLQLEVTSGHQTPASARSIIDTAPPDAYKLLERSMSERASLSNELEDSKREIIALRDELSEARRSRSIQDENELLVKSMHEELEIATTQLSSLQTDYSQKEMDLQLATRLQEEHEQKSRFLQNEVDDLKSELLTANARKDAQDKQVKSFEESESTLQSKIEAINAELIDKTETITLLQSDLDASSKNNESLREEIDQRERERAELTVSNQDLRYVSFSFLQSTINYDIFFCFSVHYRNSSSIRSS